MMSPFRVILRPVVGLAESIFGKVDFVMAHGCGHPCSTTVVHLVIRGKGHLVQVYVFLHGNSFSHFVYEIPYFECWVILICIMNVH